jgi:hypothetical protein
MTVLNYGWEIPAGDAVVPTTANSGGANHDAWNAVNHPAGSPTNETDTAHARLGAQSGRYRVGSTASTGTWEAWTTSMGTKTRVQGRIDLRLTALLASYQAFWRAYSGTTSRLQLGLNSSEQVQLLNAANSTVATFTSVVPITTWVRIEWDIELSTSAAWTIRYYADAASETVTEELSGSAAALGGSADGYRFGMPSGTASLVEWNVDNAQLRDDGLWPGRADPPNRMLTLPMFRGAR